MIRWDKRIKLLFLLPAVIWVLALTIAPLFFSLYLSFTDVKREVVITGVEEIPILDKDGNPKTRSDGSIRTKKVKQKELQIKYDWVGFKKYKRVVNDQEYQDAAKFTFIYVIISVFVEIVLGLFLAFLFNRRIYGRGFMRSLMILPIFATPFAIGFMFFTILFEVSGPLAWMGIPFLSNHNWAPFSVMLVDIWQWTPFCFLVFLAALQGIPDDLIEAATLDTKSAYKIWTSVILPLLQPIIVLVILLRVAESAKLYDYIASLTKGGPGTATQSVSFLVFNKAFKMNDFGYASAGSFLMLIVVMIFVMLFFTRLRKTYE
jgi:multiple sugar transport system permease protein|tara:strand:- start:514 stop:1467 length:954 start_codon:yes stop_codon:yes gene_type:complete